MTTDPQTSVERASDKGRNWLSRMAWVPLPLLLALIVGLWLADLRVVYESRTLMVLLNVFFTWLAALCICVLTARVFLRTGQPGLLMFGCGSLVWGVTSLAAASVVDRVNPTITIHNVGVLSAALCHLAGLLWRGRLARPGRWLGVSYAAALLAAALMVWSPLAGWTPVFFVQGQGGTPIRETVLLLAIGVFAWVAWRMLSRFRWRPQAFLYWYGLGLALVAIALIGVFLLSVQGGVLGWTNRLTQYLGSAYLFIAALASVRETGGWGISLEEALRASEDRFRAAFEGSAVAMSLTTPEGKLLRVNEAFCRMMGYSETELAERDFYQITHPDDQVANRIGVARMLGGEVASFQMEKRYRRKDGRVIWGDMSTTMVHDETGRALYMVTHVQDITERKLAQEQLARSNQRIADILGSIQDHFYVLDREWNFVFASQRFTSRIGKEPRDIVGHNIWQMFPKHVGTAFEEHLRAAMEAKETRRFEAGGQYTDAWYMMTVFPSPDGITVLGTEVTERKRAEEALRERDERFTTLVANLESGVALVDEHGQFVLYNASFLRIFGLSSSSDIHNVNNQDWGRWQVFGENGQLLEVDSHPVRKAALTRQPVRNQLVRVRRPSDGQELWLLVSAEPVLRPDGQLRLMICTYYDITQRRQSDETLRQREERLRLALQAGQMATWDWHVASGRVEWNDQHYRMLGYEVGGVPPSYEAWVQRIHSEDRPATEARLRRSMEEGGTYATEFRVLWPDGTERWIEARGQFECDAEGHAVRSYGVMLDLTERKGAEDELRRATAAAETANQAKDHFLAALSHELRTPLSPALMLVTAQENNPELPDPVRQDLITVRHSIELEVRIIDDLLDLSRVTSGKMRMHLQNISVQDVLRQAIGTCSADITGHNLQLCQEFAASEDLVHADPARLQQVFWNLLKNAAKFTPQGGKLGIRCRNINGGQVQVQVASLSCPCITLALTTQTPHF